MIKTSSKKELLKLLNEFLKHNSKANKAQKIFENKLKECLGQDELSDVMDWYIDMTLSGASKATIDDLDIIIEQAKRVQS